MNKRIFGLLFALLLCAGLSLSVGAAAPRLVDEADLLTAAEETELLTRLDEVSAACGADVVVVTVDSTGGTSPMAYADDYFDYNGYGQGTDRAGVLLLVSMAQRDWWISTSGFCIEALSDDTIAYIGESITPDLSAGDYPAAFATYVEECAYYLDGYINGFPFPVGMTLVVALVIGLVVALIVTLIMRGQLKSVRPQRAAESYVRAGSLAVTDARELFLYRQVDRRLKPQNTSSGSSTHTSSSGRSHGGGGGKF